MNFIIVLPILCIAAASAATQDALCPGGRRVSDKWDDGKTVYICNKDRDYLSVQPVGCVAPDGHRLMVGEKASIHDIVYECRLDANRVPTTYQWGCVGKDGRQYASGDSYDYNGYWYFCMERHGSMNAEMIGCVHDGRRVQHGDRWVENGVVYSCIVSMKEATIRVMGCVTRDSVTGATDEKRVGCSWQEGRPPFQYTLTCQPDDARKTAYRKAVRCDYSVEKGTYEVELGCYRVIEKTGVACLKGSGPADVNFIALQLDDRGQVRNPPSGARLC